MSFKNRVVIFGKSLNLAGISASLKLEQELDVVFVDPQEISSIACLEAMKPSVIIFDLAESPCELDMTLLRTQPGLILIGVDPSSHDALILKGQSSQVMSAGDLSQLISIYTDVKPAKRKR